MNPITLLFRAVLVSALVALASAASARADVIHVSTTGANAAACGSAASPCRTLNYAQLFRTTTDPDTIQIAAGSYDTSGVNLPAAKTTGDTIVGAGSGGPGGTFLVHPGGGPNEVLKLDVPQTLRGLLLRVPNTVAGNHRPLLINSGADGSVLEDVATSHLNNSAATSVTVDGASTVLFDRVSITGNYTGDGLAVYQAIGTIVRDSSLYGGSSGAANALSASDNSSVTLLRSRLLRAPGGSFDAVIGSVDSALTVDSSVITGGQKGIAFQATPGHAVEMNVRNSTIDAKVWGAKDAGTDVASIYARSTMPGAGSVKVRVDRSILVEDNYAFLEAGAAVSLDCFDSDVPAQENALIHCGAANGNATSPVASLFLDAGDGDYRLKPGSPAIDASAAAAPTGIESTTDRAGNPRATDGNGDCVVRIDRGAYESAAVASPNCPGNGPTGATGPTGAKPVDAKPVLDRVSLSKKSFKSRGRGRGARIRFRVSELAKLSVTVERVLPGRRSGKLCKPVTKRNRASKRRCTRYVKAGAFSFTSSKGSKSRAWTGVVGKRALSPGAYRLRLRAKDAKGQLSAERRLSFKIKR